MKRIIYLLLLTIQFGVLHAQIPNMLLNLRTSINKDLEELTTVLDPIGQEFSNDYIIALLGNDTDSVICGFAIGDFKDNPKFLTLEINRHELSLRSKFFTAEYYSYIDKYFITRLNELTLQKKDDRLPGRLGRYVDVGTNDLSQFCYISYYNTDYWKDIEGWKPFNRVDFLRFGELKPSEKRIKSDWIGKLFEECAYIQWLYRPVENM